MVASSLADAADAGAKSLVERAAIRVEAPGCDRYQQDHMSQIFRQGLSFSGFERNRVFVGAPGTTWVDVSDVSGADSEGDGRATVVADFDDDGDPDIFVNDIQRELHHLYRNDSVAAPTTFVKVRLRATRGHSDAIGAIVHVGHGGRRQARALAAGSGFESQDAPELIFGLGPDAQAEVSVRWPGRELESFGGLSAGGRYVLVEGSGRAEPRPARTFRFADPGPAGLVIREGDSLPALRLVDTGGASQTFAIGERRVLINFWATTCAACVAEMPLLQEIDASGRYRVVAVSLDPSSRTEAIAALWKKLGLGLESWRIEDDDAKRLFDISRLSLPLSLVVSREGRVERILQGRIREGDL